MCGSSYRSSYEGVSSKKESPIWKMSHDKKHMVFYADTSECSGATTWCKKHCYIKLKPANALNNIEPFYKIKYFLKPLKQEIYLDFNKAEYITMFGSGTIGNHFDYDLRNVITRFPKENPKKTFRFFIREKLIGNKSIPENVRLVFSIDECTDTDWVQLALVSKHISSLAIVDHKDNRFLIEHFKTKLPVVTCKDCNDTGYECFKKQDKNLLILKYIGN